MSLGDAIELIKENEVNTTTTFTVAYQTKGFGNRPVHALSCNMGNQGKMAGNSKVCMRFQSQLILHELIYLTLSL